MIAIVDCNSFYASCERVFRPELRTQPIVVLSNNDGCVIARSDEAKEAGIKMGAIFHKVKGELDQKKVHYFSSNYQLYGDMSDRVMRCLQSINPDIEVYSIDEAFLDLAQANIPADGLVEFGKKVRIKVWRETGIPISIGIAPTKVLAKVANRLAKKAKQKTEGVLVLQTKTEILSALAATPLSDIWGFGYKKAYKLKSLFGMTTALDCYNNMTEEIMRKQFGGVVGLRVLRELRGERSISISSGAVEKQHIASTRSFGQPINTLSELTEAISVYTERALQKMEHQQSACKTVGVFLSTDRFKKEKGYYAKSAYGVLPHPTCNPHEVIEKAVELIRDIFLPQFSYIKAGVFLASFEDVGARQLSLFEQDVFETASKSKSEKLATLLATSEKKFGKKQIAMASSGIDSKWQMRMSHCSPHYTTDWRDLPVISLPAK